MKWFIEDDHTPPVITPEGMLQSEHGGNTTVCLPETCVLFEIGMAMRHLDDRFDTETLVEELPGFLTSPKCVAIRDIPGVCFVKGGFGAPAAVDTLEALLALGVRRVVVSGMLGVFGEQTGVGDVVIPSRIKSEEGTSWHYADGAEDARPDAALHAKACAFFADRFRTLSLPTVSTDAIYRQTFRKEALWRDAGYVGVDMESSALLAVCRCAGIPAVSLLIASDKHPARPGDTAWAWGASGFREARERFVEACAAFAGTL